MDGVGRTLRPTRGVSQATASDQSLGEPSRRWRGGAHPEDGPPGVGTSRNVARTGGPPASISGKYVDSIVADRTAHDESEAVSFSQCSIHDRQDEGADGQREERGQDPGLDEVQHLYQRRPGARPAPCSRAKDLSAFGSWSRRRGDGRERRRPDLANGRRPAEC